MQYTSAVQHNDNQRGTSIDGTGVTRDPLMHEYEEVVITSKQKEAAAYEEAIVTNHHINSQDLPVTKNSEHTQHKEEHNKNALDGRGKELHMYETVLGRTEREKSSATKLSMDVARKPSTEGQNS